MDYQECVHCREGDLRVIRPFIYVRETDTRLFAESANLPVIPENCPACFEAPKVRTDFMKRCVRGGFSMQTNVSFSRKPCHWCLICFLLPRDMMLSPTHKYPCGGLLLKLIYSRTRLLRHRLIRQSR